MLLFNKLVQITKNKFNKTILKILSRTIHKFVTNLIMDFTNVCP